MKDAITKEKMYPHPIEKVWKAISEAAELSAWFVQADFKAEVGYHYTFKALGEEVCPSITGEVKEATPYTLIYTWVAGDTEVETLVKWVLEEVDGKTKLKLEHSGISAYDGDTAVKMFESFNGGWDNCIAELNNYLMHELHEARH
ncbi:MAG: SRPBCC domain-containing protein [Bacteroidota bacterium]